MIRGLAWRLLLHERMRLVAAVAGITFAVLLQMMQFGFRESLFTSAVFVHDRLRADIVLTSPQYESIVSTSTLPRRRIYEALMLKEVESVGSLNMGLIAIKDPVTRTDRQVVCLAFDPNDPAFDLAAMGADGSLLQIPDTMLFDARSRPDFMPIVDGIRRFGRVPTEVAGKRLELTGTFNLGASFTGSAHVMTSSTTFRRITHRPEGTVEVGLIRLKPGSDVHRVRAALAAAMPADVQVRTRQEFARFEQDYWAVHTAIGFIFNLGLIVGLAVGAVIVYQILYTDVNDHLSEYATLKAMGYRDSALSMVVMQEALILSLLGFPIGLVLSQGLYVVARAGTALPIEMTITRVLLVLFLTMFMCGVSGVLAMRRLKAADPADAF
jgi:putative ABC transport system permease protein